MAVCRTVPDRSPMTTASSSACLPLTVCMIVRDEADKLAAALASVRDVAREIIVVDTGSTDATVAIAQAHGARVLHFAWVDDFARARNVGLAAATGDWILSLDADQRLPAAAVPALAQAVRRGECLAQVVTIEMQHAAGDAAEVSTYAALRLFRRDPRIRYVGRVHEDIAETLLAAGSADWPDSGVRLLDGGYVDAQERRRKRLRNLALLRLAHDEAPQSLYLAYKLAITLSEASERDERRAVLARALERAQRLPARDIAGLPFASRLVALGVEELVAQGRLADAVAALRGLHAALGTPLDFTFGVALARAGLFDDARALLEAFAARHPAGQGGAELQDDDAHPVLALRWLAWIARSRGEFDVAAARLREAEARATPEQSLAIACETIELQVARGDRAGAVALCESATALAQGLPLSRTRSRGLAHLMLASAKLMQADGELRVARELAGEALTNERNDVDDDVAVLIVMLDVASGPVAPEVLRQHYDTLVGRRFDTLAVKLLLGDNLGLPWPHDVPEATRACLRDLQGG